MTTDRSTDGGQARLWRTVFLSLLACAAGGGLAGNVCYWRGRAVAEDLPYKLLTYAPENALGYLVALAFTVLWLSLWGRDVWALRHNSRPWLAAAVPGAVFAFFTWHQLGSAHACSF